jgi:hypothetical protein
MPTHLTPLTQAVKASAELLDTLADHNPHDPSSRLDAIDQLRAVLEAVRATHALAESAPHQVPMLLRTYERQLRSEIRALEQAQERSDLCAERDSEATLGLARKA